MLCRSLVRRCQAGPQGLLPKFSLHHLLGCYQCTKEDEHSSYGEMGMPVPPFGCAFSTAPDVQHVLAVANEEGFVRLYDTHTQTRSKQIAREWQAHLNAVFDLAWMPTEHKIVTASGDQTAKVWDVRTGELLGVCKGHQCSLKSVAFSKFEKAVFCTGGRDGNIMVWDTRCNKKDGFYRQVKQITGAHNIIDKQTPSKLKKKKQSIKGLAPSVDFQQSVTVVLLQDEHTLISAGAVDGVIKVWDLRKNYATYRQDPVPSRSFSYPGNSTRKLGYSSLILDSTGTSLFANCTDDNIYMFSMPSLKNTPVSSFSGHQNSSFYVKSSISPDDQFLISGSSDQTACIWKVSEPQLPPMMLHGHLQEVTSVSWCPSDFTKISTCSDDNTVKIWRLRRGIEEENWLDKSNLVGWSCQKKVGEQNETGTPNSKHGTPAKVLPSCSPPISSPQAAACAPAYLGDLPLPTNTPTWSSVKPPASTACTSVPARQKETTLGSSSKPAPPSVMSIRQWVTKTPHLSPPVKGAEMPTPQGALAGVCEATAPSKSPHSRSEMRAKRRLDSSKEENAKCLKSCNCVIELYPVFKKFRLEHNTLVIDSESCEKDWLTHSGPVQATPSLNEPPPPGNSCLPNSTHLVKESCGKMTGKENGFPGKRSWLSDLGAKQQTNKIRSPNGSGNSAHLLRNLSIRQQEAGTGVTSPGPITATSVPMRKICTYFERKSQKN
ncbi:denticleless protein homolog [Varanus komodoensis]|uniref:denticleless protein homolog n=1 Tax=Varanus komodoensis TaxID=61221 RepID=UPI001CF7AB83|nr:denticleless protein homolog [Varanus komodoensis]